MLDKLLSFFKYNPSDPIQFDSPFFFIFITIVLLGYPYIVEKVKIRTIYLLLFSLFFFYKTSGEFWLLLLGTALVNFILGKMIYSKKKDAKLYLILSIVWNLGSLSFFKYTNYIIQAFNSLSGNNLENLTILFPAGISFFTFQTMSYTIDIYRKKLKPVHSFLDFAFFVSFFPQLVAGPIVRATDFLPQIKKKKILLNDDMNSAFILIINGLFKKIVIADFLSLNFIQNVFSNPTDYSGLNSLLAVYAYAIKIYCDFSAYSDIAIGLAKLLGFDLLENFNFPYRATSLQDFWKRWHISLSSWLRDYLYIPLGGNKSGFVYLNLMITMLLGGLWHVRPNAFWTYIVWGGLHGLALVLHRIWRKSIIANTIQKKLLLSYVFRPISWLLTFNFVCLTWVFFRSDSLVNAWIILKNITSNLTISDFPGLLKDNLLVVIILLISYTFHFLPKNLDSLFAKKLSDYGIIATIIFLSIALITLNEIKSFEFIYYKNTNNNKLNISNEASDYKVQQFEYYKF